MTQPNFPCPICRFLYKTKEGADNCIKTNGIPAKANLKKGQKVYINNEYFKQQPAIVMNCAYTKPNCLSRKPHTLIYLLALPKESRTTATEQELTPVKAIR